MNDFQAFLRLAESCEPYRPQAVSPAVQPCPDKAATCVFEGRIESLDDEPDQVPFTPFPVEALPEPVRNFVTAGSVAMGCDPSFIALPLLCAIATAIGNSRRVELKKTWCEPAVIWAVTIGESGTLKSPALDLALKPLRRRQAAAIRAYKDELKVYEKSKAIHDAEMQEWKKKGKKRGDPPPEAPEPPVCRQLIAEDTTVEALAVLLADQPRGMLLTRDELAGWMNSFDAYKSTRGADVAHYLTMHRAGNLLVNRKTGQNKIIYVPRAAVSVCGGVQPSTLKAALAGRYAGEGPEKMNKPPAEHFGNGLAARLLVTMPPRIPKRWTDAEIDPAIEAAVDRVFDELLALEAGRDDAGEWVPVDLPLHAKCKVALDRVLRRPCG